ncbi:MAG: glycine cleavage system aminomethyltransferase GcvT [Chloroflexota bacterium]
MKHTPLYQEHLRLGAKMVEFGGWEMPLNFPTGIIAEHLATRKHGGLFDISHMGRFHLSGKGVLPFLQYVLTNNAAALKPGEAQYTIIPDETGGAVDDAYLYCLEENDYLLVVNAANTEKDWAWFKLHQIKFAGFSIEDKTRELAMLSLQGPEAKAILGRCLEDTRKIPEPVRNHFVTIDVTGAKTTIARTGYTGEAIGFEILIPAGQVVPIYQRLLDCGRELGLVPVGLGARDTLRLEAGLPLYGHELGLDAEGREIPIFALTAARIAVSFAEVKGDFIGREKLSGQFEEVKVRQEGLLKKEGTGLAVPRSIMPLMIKDGIARAGYPVYIGERPVGYITSGTAVPYWEFKGEGMNTKPGGKSSTRAIALAYLDSDLREGQRVSVLIRDKRVEGTVVRRFISREAPPYARPVS